MEFSFLRNLRDMLIFIINNILFLINNNKPNILSSNVIIIVWLSPSKFTNEVETSAFNSSNIFVYLNVIFLIYLNNCFTNICYKC